jgi:hypothetical protein
MIDKPAADPHRMVLLYTVHGVGMLDMPTIFRSDSRYLKALLDFDHMWEESGGTGKTHSPFTCDYLRALVRGGPDRKQGVIDLIYEGWRKRGHQLKMPTSNPIS